MQLQSNRRIELYVCIANFKKVCTQFYYFYKEATSWRSVMYAVSSPAFLFFLVWPSMFWLLSIPFESLPRLYV